MVAWAESLLTLSICPGIQDIDGEHYTVACEPKKGGKLLESRLEAVTALIKHYGPKPYEQAQAIAEKRSLPAE